MFSLICCLIKPLRPECIECCSVICCMTNPILCIDGVRKRVRRTASEFCRILSRQADDELLLSCRTQANDLAVLISRMQTNADQVEKNILQSEQLLAVVGGPHIRLTRRNVLTRPRYHLCKHLNVTSDFLFIDSKLFLSNK